MLFVTCLQVVTSLLSKGAARVACGGNVTAVVSFNGLLQMCGEAAHGALGSGDTAPDRPTPQLVQAFISMEVTEVAVGPYHTVVATASPRGLFAWGRADKGRLGLGRHQRGKRFTLPVSVPLPDHKGIVVRVCCGRNSTMVLFDGGQLCVTPHHSAARCSAFLLSLYLAVTTTAAFTTAVHLQPRASQKHSTP